MTITFPSKAVIEQGGEYGAIPQAFERLLRRSDEQPPRLMIRDGRRLALVAFGSWPFDPLHRIVCHRMFVAEVLKQSGESREPVPDRGAGQNTITKVIPPGDHVSWRHKPEFLRSLNPGKLHEVPNGISVGTLRVRVPDVLEPLDLRRNVSQSLEFGGRQ